MMSSPVLSTDVARSVFVLVALLLSSCGGSDDNTTELQLSPDAIRQISVIDGNPLKLDISVTSGPRQDFILSSVESVSIDITGVNVDQQNSIEIVWSEILNGFDVEISQQNQSFLADGNTNINAPHQHTLFDYDGDGVSNFDERLAGTCVWSDDPDCTFDVPANEPVDTVTLNTFPEQLGINVLQNSQFDQGRAGWSSNAIDISTFGAEYCLSSSLITIFPENVALMTAQGLFLLEPGVRYTFSGDVRSDIPASPVMRVEEGAPSFTTVHQTTVEIGTEYRTVSTSFIAQDDHTVNVMFWFGDGRPNRFCVDNVVFVKGTL